ncbi:uncharacterized protein [Rutidosis leptorrhynchoides]|uniref:uncharacterized protein n=1 Tax=Rutidosis leptorrhynchoides TaxID=125765 RepID=UPI003A999B0F
MEDRFLQRIFPALKAVKLQCDINHFVQNSNETLYDAWTRFSKMLRNCPQHGLKNFNKVQIFYKGVNVPKRKEIDIAACGSLMKMTPDEAYNIISKIDMHSYDWHQEIDVSLSSYVASTETSDELASVKAQLATVKRQMESMTKEMHAMKVGCELCQGQHLTKDCNQATMEEQVNYLERPPGSLPSNTQANLNFNGLPRTILTNNNRSDVKNKDPKVSTFSQVNAISSFEGYDSDEVVPTYTHNGEDGWIPVSDIIPTYGNYLMSLMTGSSSNSINQESKVKSVETTESPEFSVDEIKVEEEVKPPPKLKVYKLPIPYPRAIQSEQQKDTVCMPNYGKFLKDLMAKKGEHEQASSAILEVECATILKKSDMPPKLGDLGPFIVPCKIDDSKILKCLTNSGVSINLMPLSVYSRLGELEFSADFVVVDMPKDKVVPIILGRPFLATAGALTDWWTCKLILRDIGITLSFKTKFSVKPPPTSVDSVNVLTSSEIVNVETETSKEPKCGGGVVKEKYVVKPPDDSVVDRSMRRYDNVMKIEEWPLVQSYLSLRFAIMLLYIRLCFSQSL